MGRTQKHQSKGAAALDSEQDSSVPDSAEGDYITLATVRELLKVQESTFKSLFESTIHALTLRVDSVVKDVQEMKTSLQFTQKDVEDLKPIHVKLEGINKELDKMISRDLASHSQKMEYLENQSRRNNIRLNGIQNLTMKLGKTQKLRLNERSRTTWALKLTSKGLTGWKGGKLSRDKQTRII